MHNYVPGTHAQDRTETVTDRDAGLGPLRKSETWD